MMRKERIARFNRATAPMHRHVEPGPRPECPSEGTAAGQPPNLAPRRRSAQAVAIEWLRELLAEGPRSAEEVQRAAKDANNISWRTIQRVKTKAGVKSFKTEFGGAWFFGIAEECQQASNIQKYAEGAQRGRDIPPLFSVKSAY